jgi:hypothetical protein
MRIIICTSSPNMTRKSRTVDCKELALVELIRNAKGTGIEKYEKRIPRETEL